MKINNILPSKSVVGRQVTFSRKLKKEEQKEYSKTINQAMDYLGIDNRALVVHGPSFPANKKGYDQRIGSPYGADDFLKFINLHGFNQVQLGPMGKLNRGDNSPYTSSVIAKNPLFIDFEQLTTSEFASILSKEDIEEVMSKPVLQKENYTKTDFAEAKKINDELIDKAYTNLRNKIHKGDERAIEFKKEFNAYKSANKGWLKDYATLDIIAAKYGFDYYPNWKKEDKELVVRARKGDKKAIKEQNNLIAKNFRAFELYKFSQFLVEKQSKNHKNDVTYISDLLVGVSSFDELLNEDVFLKDYKLGAKWGGAFNSPQLWGIPIVDFDKLFNEDGSLGPAGEFFKEKLQKAIADSKSIRIDHTLGFVDPFLYNPNTVKMASQANEEGEMVEYPIREGLEADYLSRLGIDKNNNYQRLVEEIVLPTMIEMGLDPKKVVWEDIGYDETGLFDKNFRKKLGLPGIDGLAWTKGQNAKPENWAFIGCHDNPPVQIMVRDEEMLKGSNGAWHADYLANYLMPHPNKTQQRNELQREIETDKKALIKAKFADLFRSTKNIQVSFMDFFGINKAYNTPGTNGEHNWTLRISPNYEDEYYKALQEDNYALNMPEVLATAVEAKAQSEEMSGKTREESNEILEKLNHFSEILKEK